MIKWLRKATNSEFNLAQSVSICNSWVWSSSRIYTGRLGKIEVGRSTTPPLLITAVAGISKAPGNAVAPMRAARPSDKYSRE
ncbi:hypothetical protein TUM17377_31620 [Shewanella chilikensis]|nr:hypothetical protein TUM17377_31620 [Shewanella chilikensis]